MSILSWFKSKIKGTPKVRELRTFELPPSTVRVDREFFEFKPGDRIIAISNEDEPYKIGNIVRYVPITLARQLTPIVKFDGDDEEYLCLSHLEHYSEELCKELDTLSGIEQWNRCVHDHCQLKQHKGIKYRTFECGCDSCTKRRSEP